MCIKSPSCGAEFDVTIFTFDRIMRNSFTTCALILYLAGLASGEPPTMAEVVARMHPYDGVSVEGVDTTTLTGKVMCGYQGWFSTPDDGAQRGWTHYSRRGRFEPGYCTIDLWPDMSDLDEDEKFPTVFRHADGSVASVFSSFRRKTVLRHFRWMKEYGIDGGFVQRFAVQTFRPLNLNHGNTVLMHCREGANLHGRAYAVMYDLSGLRAGQMGHVMDDWKTLVDGMRIGRDDGDQAYLHERGKPVVAVWGIGFNDGRRYSLDECLELVRFLKHDPQYGGCTVMLGVPTGWRTLDRDCLRDEKVHEIILQADIVSPWTVGRYSSLASVARHAEQRWQKDILWCRQQGKAYLPVVFPGFSWHNMKPDSPLDQIPRQKGRFLWSQYVQAKKVGATMIYQAMFDEIDEGTAIFKCTNSPPVGASPFLTYEGLPSDHYLWLTGMGGRLLRGEMEASDQVPRRN
jgi:hypothetical protein